MSKGDEMRVSSETAVSMPMKNLLVIKMEMMPYGGK